MEHKKCTLCKTDYPATSEYFAPKKNGLTGQCRTCLRETNKQYKLAKNCPKTLARWNKSKLKKPAKQFQALRICMFRFYNEIVKKCTDSGYWEFKDYGGAGVVNEFKDFDEFLYHLIFNLGYDNAEAINDNQEPVKDLKIARIDSNEPYRVGNVELISELRYYQEKRLTKGAPRKLICPKCHKPFYQTKSSGYCNPCTRKVAKEYGQSTETKAREKRRSQTKKRKGSIESHLFKLYERLRPYKQDFLFRNNPTLVLLKFPHGAEEFVKHALEILNGRDPRTLQIDLIDSTGHVEPGNIEFLTDEEFGAKHNKGGNNNV